MLIGCQDANLSLQLNVFTFRDKVTHKKIHITHTTVDVYRATSSFPGIRSIVSVATLPLTLNVIYWATNRICFRREHGIGLLRTYHPCLGMRFGG